jgi:hypothetical protein
MGNRLGTRPLTGPALVLGLLGAVLLAVPAMASTTQQPAGSEQSTDTTTAAPLASEASPISVHADCVREGRKLRINYTVRTWEPELTAPEVEVWFQVTGGRREPLPAGSFGPGQEAFSGHFLIDAPAEEGTTLVLIARAHWTDPTEKSLTKKSQPLPLPVCLAGETTTSAPTTTVGGATSTTAVRGAPSTTAGGQLPFTGRSSTPTVLAGLGLLACGAVLLWAGRRRQPS